MKRALILLAIFGPSIIITIAVWAVRSTRAAGDREQPKPLSQIVVPAGMHVEIRLVSELTEATHAGDSLEALTAEPVLVDTQVAIPADTRAVVRILSLRKIKGRSTQATLQFEQLISKNGEIPVRSGPIEAAMKRTSDVGLAARAVEGMLGGAIGAAGGAAVGGSPSVGASAVGTMAAGASAVDERVFLFQIAVPLDLTGIKW